MQITKNGEKDVKFIQVTDHLYEEEILEESPACWFSKTGEKLHLMLQMLIKINIQRKWRLWFFSNEGDGEGKQTNMIVKIMKKDLVIIPTMHRDGSADDYPDNGVLPKKNNQWYISYAKCRNSIEVEGRQSKQKMMI